MSITRTEWSMWQWHKIRNKYNAVWKKHSLKLSHIRNFLFFSFLFIHSNFQSWAGIVQSVKWLATTWMTRIQFHAVAGIFLFTVMSSLPLSPTQGIFPWRQCGWSMKLTTHLHLVPVLRMWWAIAPFLYMSPWCDA